MLGCSPHFSLPLLQTLRWAPACLRGGPCRMLRAPWNGAFAHGWSLLWSDWLLKNVSGYVCNHGSPSGERDTASPRGRYGERPQRDSVWRYIWKNTTCWPATAHDVTTGVPQYKCRREDTSSASSSEACVRSMAQSPGDAVSRSPLGEPWLHT